MIAHMSMPSTDRIEELARAIADPTRRRILDRLAARPGSTTGELAALTPGLTRFAVMKHLEVLRLAGLIRSMPEGRRRRHYLERAALDPLRVWLGER
jgi:DNA-binding transcriptional ArsR family regulator